MKMEVSGHATISTPTIVYLEVMSDAKLNFTEHLEYAYQKAADVTVALAKMLAKWQIGTLSELLAVWV